MWDEFNGIRDSVGFGTGVIAGIISVVFGSWAYIVPKSTPVGPGESVSGSVMNDDLTAWGSQWCFIKVEVAMDECMC